MSQVRQPSANSVCQENTRFVWRESTSKWDENGRVKCGGKEQVTRNREFSMAGKRGLRAASKRELCMATKCELHMPEK